MVPAIVSTMDMTNKITITLYTPLTEQRKVSDLEPILTAAENALIDITGDGLVISYLETDAVWEKE